jgi:hypothetical protein
MAASGLSSGCGVAVPLLAGLSRRPMIVRAQVIGIVAVEQILSEDAEGSDNLRRWRRRYQARRLRRFGFFLRALREAEGRYEHHAERREQ